MAPIVKDFTHAEIAKAWDVGSKSIDVGIYKIRKAGRAAQTSEQGQNNSSERSSGPPSEPEKLNKSENPDGEPDVGEDGGDLAVHTP